ncbi:MAG: hypothetical protein HYS04_15870 [Acidobacteria bacterium]|nr:hypothetical protein [Acidobacteriota bacterium]
MVRTLALAVVFALAASAANIKLYLKDGGYHVVSEYKKLTDRVRYFSVERGEWEEIPVELVDLKRTQAEIKAGEEARKEETAVFDAEEKAEREHRREIERIPINPGVYRVRGEQVEALKQAESKIVNNKRRSILKAMSPIPIVAGKATVELDGPHSAAVVREERPEFYIQLAAEERFAIVRLKPSKTGRIVQTWNIVPVTKEIVEEMETVETFKQQVDEGLYKIWPQKPLAAGEYAVIEYTEAKGNVQTWDFSVGTGPASAKRQ